MVMSQWNYDLTNPLNNSRHRKWTDRTNYEQHINEYNWNMNAAWEEYMLDKKNEWNSPANQMDLLREAGVNPNSLFSGGSMVSSASNGSPGMFGAADPSMSDVTGAAGAIMEGLNTISNGVNSATDQVNKVYGQKLVQAQIDNVKQDTANKKIEGMDLMTNTINNSIYGGRERASGLASQAQERVESQHRVRSLDQQVNNLKLDGKAQEIANNFNKENNQWLLSQSEQTLENLKHSYDVMTSSITANNAAARQSNAQADLAGIQTETQKKIQPFVEQFNKAQSEQAQTDAAYQAWRLGCVENNIDPDSDTGTRMWQGILSEMKKSGGWKSFLANGAYAIGAVLDKAGNVVSTVAGGVMAKKGLSNIMKNGSAPTINPIIQDQSRYNGTYGDAPWNQ